MSHFLPFEAWKNDAGPLQSNPCKFRGMPTDTAHVPDPVMPSLRVCKAEGSSIIIPRDVRDKWLTDPIRSPTWRDVLRKFDVVFTADEPINPEPEADTSSDAADVVIKPELTFDWDSCFSGSPRTEDELSTKKISHSTPLSIKGAHFNITEDEEVYILASEDVTIPSSLWLIGYGAGTWLQDDKARAFLLSPGACKTWIQCTFQSDQDVVIFEEDSDSHRPTDSAPHTLRERFHLLERAGHIDLRLGGHKISRPAAVQQGRVSDKCH